MWEWDGAAPTWAPNLTSPWGLGTRCLQQGEFGSPSKPAHLWITLPFGSSSPRSHLWSRLPSFLFLAASNLWPSSNRCWAQPPRRELLPATTTSSGKSGWGWNICPSIVQQHLRIPVIPIRPQGMRSQRRKSRARTDSFSFLLGCGKWSQGKAGIKKPMVVLISCKPGMWGLIVFV